MDIETQKYINEQEQKLFDDLQKQESEIDKELDGFKKGIGHYQNLMSRRQQEFDMLSKKYEAAKEKSGVSAN